MDIQVSGIFDCNLSVMEDRPERGIGENMSAGTLNYP